MTSAFWLTVGQTIVFLAVCAFAVWVARVTAEAADDSALAAEKAVMAARDAERTAADIREMRDMLRTWLDQEQDRVSSYRREPPPGEPRSAGRVGTDTAEAQVVLTPQAIIDRGRSTDFVDHEPRGGAVSTRGRHAHATKSSWSAALRSAASRTSRNT